MTDHPPAIPAIQVRKDGTVYVPPVDPPSTWPQTYFGYGVPLYLPTDAQPARLSRAALRRGHAVNDRTYAAWYREEWGRVWVCILDGVALDEATTRAALALTRPYVIEAAVVSDGTIPMIGRFPFHWRASRVRRKTTLDSRTP